MTKVSVSVAATAIAKISSGGVGALTDLLVDDDRLREPVDQRRGDVEVVAGQGGEADHPVERAAQRRAAAPGAAPGGSLALARRPRISTGSPSTSKVPPSTTRLR